jgi:hypothetical protein
MSQRALENHEAMVRQMEDIYRASGEDNPFLAGAFNAMIRVSFWTAFYAPDRAPRHKETVK